MTDPYAALDARPQEAVRPGSPEASAMIDSVLAEYNWPSNPKNAARAGFVAAQRMLAAAPPAPQTQRPVRLTDEQSVKCLVEAGCVGTVKMTYESGPYEITVPTMSACRLISAVEDEVLRINGIGGDA